MKSMYARPMHLTRQRRRNQEKRSCFDPLYSLFASSNKAQTPHLLDLLRKPGELRHFHTEAIPSNKSCARTALPQDPQEEIFEGSDKVNCAKKIPRKYLYQGLGRDPYWDF